VTLTAGRTVGACAIACLWISAVEADPWLAPGNASVRTDIQMLADAGILHGPVTTWPISWPDIARDVLVADETQLDAATAGALMRILRLARQAAAPGSSRLGTRLSGSYEPSMLREFDDSPRDEGEVALHTSWLGSRFALNLQGTYVVNPADGQRIRADGSYLGLNFGNFMLSAGYMERWWGPGWDGSLILSTNARPIPTATLERNYTDPFESKWLSWIGPWRASVAMGRAESSDVPVPDVRFFAARVNFKPRPWLEFGLTRTAQWCGGERSCDWSTFVDMVLGHDNQLTNGAVSAQQPGNQMAGYDMRLRSPWHALPIAFYTQWIGEDEAAGLPSKFIGLFGLEGWGSSRLGSWRLRAEYADTACNFPRQDPDFGCAYRNSIYPQGYTYRGRIIGDSIDNDSRRFTLAMLVTLNNGDFLGISLRRLNINRDGGPHAISEVPMDVDNVELRYSRDFGSGSISVGVGHEDPPTRADSASMIHGFVTWQQGF
jgi:hypothetical protein